MLYLGKYIKEIEKLDGDIKIPEDSLFKKEIIGLIPRKKIEVTTTKTIIKNYKEYKYNINNNIFDHKGILMELNPNFILVNNDLKNFYIINSIKGDKIAKLNINNNNFSLCEKIKKYNFKIGETPDKNIEENKSDNNYILLNDNQSSYVLSATKEDK